MVARLAREMTSQVRVSPFVSNSGFFTKLDLAEGPPGGRPSYMTRRSEAR